MNVAAPTKMLRKVIKIRAEDSPNVRLALEQKARGETPTGQRVIEGVLSWDEYCYRRQTWDEFRQCTGLDAEFYEGHELLMFPGKWLNRAHTIHAALPKGRKAEAIGIDPAEGGDKTSMCAVDRYGIIELVARKTPNTADIVKEAIIFLNKHSCPAHKVFFDRGGGGKQHADTMRDGVNGVKYDVQTVGFGDGVTAPIRSGKNSVVQRINVKEQQASYYNRRAEMYDAIRKLIDPSLNPQGFGIPHEYKELRRQMQPIPLRYDGDGKLWLLPKQAKTPQGESLTKLIGCSPDETDSLALAVWGMNVKPTKRILGRLM